MIRHIKTGQSAEAKAENSAQVRKTVEGDSRRHFRARRSGCARVLGEI